MIYSDSFRWSFDEWKVFSLLCTAYSHENLKNSHFRIDDFFSFYYGITLCLSKSLKQFLLFSNNYSIHRNINIFIVEDLLPGEIEETDVNHVILAGPYKHTEKFSKELEQIQTDRI